MSGTSPFGSSPLKSTLTQRDPYSSPTAQNRIFWVTDNDDPLAGEEQLYGPIRKRREVS